MMRAMHRALRICALYAAGGVLAGVACGPRVITEPEGPSLPTKMDLPLPHPPADPLGVAERSIAAARVDEARSALAKAPAGARRTLLSAKLALLTGRYETAAKEAAAVQEAPEDLEAARVGAEALWRLGRWEEAEAVLKAVSERPGARGVRLALGELLSRQGRADEAEAVLMTLIDDYNEGKIRSSDARALAMVGRAAYLLGAVQDANDAFNEAEQAKKAPLQTLLWRAELFLENYDTGHAAEVLDEAKALAPRHPAVRVGLARVKLDENLDFSSATELADDALAVDPQFASAHGIHASVALRDLDFERADAHLDRGLEKNPKDLELRSLRAAVRFLADDRDGFADAKRAVLDLNPRYSKLYQIIGDYADWEHRYAEIVDLMREALATNAHDPKVRAQLGINLIRLGDDKAGVESLRRAFVEDPFNVRVFNTLELYEKVIPKSYTDVDGGRFSIRYHREEKPVLERYVPDLLGRAYGVFRKAYRFSPKEPIGVELYPEREHFAIRTSGLPHTYIQGVCFGRTLAAMSPGREHFNFGMTLWHELAHVFHIQLSNSRVPRWFTEGLAEYETLVARPEWKREHDVSLYDALRTGRLPEVADMNRAFSHARDMSDMATAYYASSQIVAMMADQYGREKLRKMLVLWSEGKRTPEVIQLALGKTPAEIDEEFRSHTEQRLSYLANQFVPKVRPDDVDEAHARVKESPKDPDAAFRFAHALGAAGQTEAADKALDHALTLGPDHPDTQFLAALRALGADEMAVARKHLQRLLDLGADGYEVQMALARVAEEQGDGAAHAKALQAAHAFDPSATEPLVGLYVVAKEAEDTAGQVRALRALVALEEHDAAAARALIGRLLDLGQVAEAREVGEAAVYADMEGVETHVLYARALEASGDARGAAFEFESATLCPGPPEALADAHEARAAFAERHGQRKVAAESRREAARLRSGAPPP